MGGAVREQALDVEVMLLGDIVESQGVMLGQITTLKLNLGSFLTNR